MNAMQIRRALACGMMWLPAAALGQDVWTVEWFTVDAGGGHSSGGVFDVESTLAQPDANWAMTGENNEGLWTVFGGYWTIGDPGATPSAPAGPLGPGGGSVLAPCYANCDNSTTQPILNIDDFVCFINAFAEAQMLPEEEQIGHYANCDGSTASPVLTVNDFVCFVNEFAAGCP